MTRDDLIRRETEFRDRLITEAASMTEARGSIPEPDRRLVDVLIAQKRRQIDMIGELLAKARAGAI